MKLEDLIKAYHEAGLEEEDIKAELQELANEINAYIGGEESQEQEGEIQESPDEQKKRIFGL